MKHFVNCHSYMIKGPELRLKAIWWPGTKVQKDTTGDTSPALNRRICKNHRKKPTQFYVFAKIANFFLRFLFQITLYALRMTSFSTLNFPNLLFLSFTCIVLYCIVYLLSMRYMGTKAYCLQLGLQFTVKTGLM